MKKEKVKQPVNIVGWVEMMGSTKEAVGGTIGICKSWGGYLRYKTDMNIVAESYSEIDRDKRAYSRGAITGGLMKRLFSWCYLYCGAGYGKCGAAYRIVDTKNYYCPDLQRGLEVEGGVVLTYEHISLSVGYNTLLFTGSKQQFSDVSVGFGIYDF